MIVCESFSDVLSFEKTLYVSTYKAGVYFDFNLFIA